MDPEHRISSPALSTSGDNSHKPSSAAYKRASRKNAPRRFPCEWPGCDKIYSRSEHLQRHILNHDPKEIFACDEPGCDHKFVRSDLLARHKKRHSANYIPRSRNSSVADIRAAIGTTTIPERPGTMSNNPAPAMGRSLQRPDSAPSLRVNYNNFDSSTATQSTPIGQRPPSQQNSLPYFYVTQPQPQPSFHTAPMYTAPISAVRTQPPPVFNTPDWGQQASTPSIYQDMIVNNRINNSHLSLGQLSTSPNMVHNPTLNIHVQQAFHNTSPVNDCSPEQFTAWLFNSAQASGQPDVNMTTFMDNGLESAFNNNLQYDQDSLGTISQPDLTPLNMMGTQEGELSDQRQDELVVWIQRFADRHPKYVTLMPNILHRSSNNSELSILKAGILRRCLQQFWESVSPRMPIIHQTTFSASTCSVFVLLIMIALGASQLEDECLPGQELRALANLIATCSRWDILTTDAASPPIDLCVAQALLLLELYEKMYSTRKLHERANIYHTATITLLRRGSPLIGQASVETPDPDDDAQPHLLPDSQITWRRWVETESMHRVVFGAFMMDTIHAAMFGHAADMTPQEIRLPLPCDNSLWSASDPHSFWQAESVLKYHGLHPPVPFLLGLKNAIHGQETRTHPFGRMIIMCGLLSVGWHLRNRETHLKWLDLQSSSSSTRDTWSRMLLKAFDGWKASLERSITPHNGTDTGPNYQPNGLMESPAVLYHLAHISLYANIVDCQVFAGAKVLLGRKISSQDYANAVKRIRSWAAQPVTRLAVLHSFRLVRCVLCDTNYSCAEDDDPHRPWTVFYATLCVWSFARAHQPRQTMSSSPILQTMGSKKAAEQYIMYMASLAQIEAHVMDYLITGLPLMIGLVSSVLAEGRSEILQEAYQRLMVCRKMLEVKERDARIDQL